MQGTVKWFNNQKGYGFIEKADGGDIFVHHSGIAKSGFRSLEPGVKVDFEIEETPKGPRAVSVKELS